MNHHIGLEWKFRYSIRIVRRSTQYGDVSSANISFDYIDVFKCVPIVPTITWTAAVFRFEILLSRRNLVQGHSADMTIVTVCACVCGYEDTVTVSIVFKPSTHFVCNGDVQSYIRKANRLPWISSYCLCYACWAAFNYPNSLNKNSVNSFASRRRTLSTYFHFSCVDFGFSFFLKLWPIRLVLAST